MKGPPSTFLNESDRTWPEGRFQFPRQSVVDTIAETGDFGSSVTQCTDKNGFW
jgi:hypothetical protein